MPIFYQDCKADAWSPALGPACTLFGYILFWVNRVSFWYQFLIPSRKFHKTIFGNHGKPRQPPPTPFRYKLRNLALQLHAPVNSDFLFINLLDPSECIAIKIFTVSGKHRLQNLLPAAFILEYSWIAHQLDIGMSLGRCHN